MDAEPLGFEGERRIAHFDVHIFDVRVIKEAAYRFSDRLEVDIQMDGDTVRCTLVPLKPIGSIDLDALTAEFRAEVLDCDLRATLRRETEPLRNFVLSLAFSKVKTGQ